VRDFTNEGDPCSLGASVTRDKPHPGRGVGNAPVSEKDACAGSRPPVEPPENNGGLKHQSSAIILADAISGAPLLPALGYSREVTHMERHDVVSRASSCKLSSLGIDGSAGTHTKQVKQTRFTSQGAHKGAR